MEDERRKEKATAVERTSPWWVNLIAAGLPGVLGIQVGLNLYSGNHQELVGGERGVAELAIVCALFSLVLFLLLQSRWRGGRLLWLAATAYSVFFLVRESAFPLPLSEIDGSSWQIVPSVRYLLLETATLAGAGLILFRLRPQIVKHLAAAATLVFGISSLGTALATPALWQQKDRAEPKLAAPAASRPANRQLPDVYHILFDEYATVEHRFLRRVDGIGPFADFIGFPDTIANYNRTWLSVPSLLTSTEYSPPQPIKSWFASYQTGGLLKCLKENGYTIRIFGYHRHWWRTPYADAVRSTTDIVREHADRKKKNEFLALVSLRTMPSFLGAELIEGWLSRSQGPALTDWPYFCTIKFREMVDGIRNTPAGGNYTFIHTILPHGPAVVDEHGNYVGKEKASRISQVRCAERLLGELIAELKRLNRYDNCLIVVHGDTADYADPDLDRQKLVRERNLISAVPAGMSDQDWQDGVRWPVEMVRARAAAALLFKPPHHQGHQLRTCPSQLMDIPPTILGLVGLAGQTGQFPGGCDLFANPPSPDRVRRTCVMGKKIGGIVVRRMQQYVVVNGRFERGAIIPVDDD